MTTYSRFCFCIVRCCVSPSDRKRGKKIREIETGRLIDKWIDIERYCWYCGMVPLTTLLHLVIPIKLH